jgi:hypothetical protein
MSGGSPRSMKIGLVACGALGHDILWIPAHFLSRQLGSPPNPRRGGRGPLKMAGLGIRPGATAARLRPGAKWQGATRAGSANYISICTPNLNKRPGKNAVGVSHWVP